MDSRRTDQDRALEVTIPPKKGQWLQHATVQPHKPLIRNFQSATTCEHQASLWFQLKRQKLDFANGIHLLKVEHQNT